MDSSGRPAFKYNSTWQKIKNNVSDRRRFIVTIAGIVAMMLLPMEVVGIQNSNALKARADWIANEVRDVKIEMNHLDREDPPEPLEHLNDREIFRAKFNKLREKDIEQ